MSKFIVIEAYCSTGIVGSTQQDEYETDITQEEWDAISEDEQEAILQQYTDDHLANNINSGAWVKEE